MVVSHYAAHLWKSCSWVMSAHIVSKTRRNPKFPLAWDSLTSCPWKIYGSKSQLWLNWGGESRIVLLVPTGLYLANSSPAPHHTLARGHNSPPAEDTPLRTAAWQDSFSGFIPTGNTNSQHIHHNGSLICRGFTSASHLSGLSHGERSFVFLKRKSPEVDGGRGMDWWRTDGQMGDTLTITLTKKE